VKKCIYCHNEIDDDVRFCPICGGNNDITYGSDNNEKVSINSIYNLIRHVKFFYGHIALIIGSLIAAITLITLSINNLNVGSMDIVKVEGTVTEIYERTRYDENFEKDVTEYYYVISYEYADKEYTYNTQEGISSKGEIGSKFDLYILSNHPEAAEMVSPQGIAVVGKVALGFGILMAIVCIANIFIVSYKFVIAYKRD